MIFHSVCCLLLLFWLFKFIEKGYSLQINNNKQIVDDGTRLYNVYTFSFSLFLLIKQ